MTTDKNEEWNETEMPNTDKPLLAATNHPGDLRKLSLDQLSVLAGEIRRELIEVIADNGGHLASNLGAVELTISLLRVFGEDEDRIVWDTGHQAYTYKLLTGRRELFKKLRQNQGCCGFLSREESQFDVFGAGHAGTAISAATGVAAARERMNTGGRVLAVVGDGALGCGTSLEGLNSVIETTNRLMVVLNDNKMSISPNVGALSRYLNRIISDRRYNRVKSAISRTIERIPGIGHCLHRLLHRAQESAKYMLVDAVFFEELGFRYIGPLDGHDINQLVATLERVKPLDTQPLLIHVLTEKGRGYEPAEKDPAGYHGLGGFDPETGKAKTACANDTSPAKCSFGDGLGEHLCRMMNENSRIVAITAGMCDGTGLGQVRKRHQQRFFDVGIAEEHAAIFAAGMATQGYRPVVAIYASFMQRALDYAFHDAALQNLPVVFCLDRAGAVPDGPTHHGIHDLGFWQSIPNITVMQPMDINELRAMLQYAMELEGTCVIRYPKCDNAASINQETSVPALRPEQPVTVRSGTDVALWCLGYEVKTGIETADILARSGIQASVVNPRFIVPFDDKLLKSQASAMPIVTIEDHCLDGGLATRVNSSLTGAVDSETLNFGWPSRRTVPWGDVRELRRQFGLDSESVAGRVKEWLHK